MSPYYKRFTREDVMQGHVAVSGTFCDFECIILGEFPLQYKVDEGIYTIDYHRTRALKHMLRMEMVETRQDINVNRMGQAERDDWYWRQWHGNSNLNPNAKEFVPQQKPFGSYQKPKNILDIITWTLFFLNNYNHAEVNVRVDPCILASIEKVNDWFNLLEEQGVSFYEKPDLYENYPEPPVAVIANQSICPEELFREYRRRMDIVHNIQNITAEYNPLFHNIAAEYNTFLHNVPGEYGNM